jgi:hypothetical protein
MSRLPNTPLQPTSGAKLRMIRGNRERRSRLSGMTLGINVN